MKYYSETDVKEMIDYAIAYGTDITSYCPSLDDYPSIDIKEPHGRCIDADALAEYYDNLEADNGVYTEQAGETADTIRNAPTVLEANYE